MTFEEAVKADRLRRQIGDRVKQLEDPKFTRAEPLYAAYVDLERKVLENELRDMRGEPATYRALYF